MKKTNEAAKQAGVTRRTLQYYDNEGLLALERGPDNHRIYDLEALERIWQILLYKEMHFELKEIRYLLDCSEEQRQVYFTHKKQLIKNQMDALKVQAGFLSLVQKYGLLPAPSEESGVTYTKKIEELREKIKKEFTKDEEVFIYEK